MTKTQLLFSRAAYDPNRLHVLGRAFAHAWENMSESVKGPATDVEATRTVLAKVILSLPSSEFDDAERIADTALQVMASGYRRGLDSLQ